MLFLCFFSVLFNLWYTTCVHVMFMLVYYGIIAMVKYFMIRCKEGVHVNIFSMPRGVCTCMYCIPVYLYMYILHHICAQNMATGTAQVELQSLQILNATSDLPFPTSTPHTEVILCWFHVGKRGLLENVELG